MMQQEESKVEDWEDEQLEEVNESDEESDNEAAQTEDGDAEFRKGFLSFEFPFTYAMGDTYNRVFLNEKNYEEKYNQAKQQKSLNKKGMLPYYLTHYQLEDDGFGSCVIPTKVQSSNRNEVAVIDWPLFSKCTRVGVNKFIVTGGVLLQYSASQIEQNFKRFLAFHEHSKPIEDEKAEFIASITRLKNRKEELRSKRFESLDTEEGVTELMNFVSEYASEAQEFKQTEEISWQGIEDPKQLQGALVLAFEKELEYLGKSCKKVFDSFEAKLNVKRQEMAKEIAKDPSEIDRDAPYQRTAIELRLHFDEDLDQNVFTAKYLPEMPFGRSNHEAVFHKGNLYVFGGVNSLTTLASVLKYDISAKTWTDLPDLSRPRMNFTATSFKDHIYVLGGHARCFYEQSEEIALLERINPEKSQSSASETQNADAKEADGQKMTKEERKLKMKLKMAQRQQQGPAWEKLQYKAIADATVKQEKTHQLNLVSYNGSLVLVGGYARAQKEDQEGEAKANAWRIEVLEDSVTTKPREWTIHDTNIQLSVRQRQSVVEVNSEGDNADSVLIFGGNNQVRLEGFNSDADPANPTFALTLDNDFSEQISIGDPSFRLSQPCIFTH